MNVLHEIQKVVASPLVNFQQSTINQEQFSFLALNYTKISTRWGSSPSLFFHELFSTPGVIHSAAFFVVSVIFLLAAVFGFLPQAFAVPGSTAFAALCLWQLRVAGQHLTVAALRLDLYTLLINLKSWPAPPSAGKDADAVLRIIQIESLLKKHGFPLL